MRSVQAIASSQPPPSAKPLMAAMTGLPRCSIDVEHVLPGERVLAAAVGRLHGQLVDVGAGDERLLAGAGQDDRADAGVALELEQSARPVRRASGC